MEAVEARSGQTAAFWMRFGMPVAVATLVSLALIGFGMWRAAARSDAISVERQERVAVRAVEANLDALPEAESPFALWDELVIKSRRRVDPSWFAVALGAQSGSEFRGTETYLLDPDDRPIYGTWKGAPASAFESARPDLRTMIDEVRGRILPHGHSRDRLYGIGPAPQSTGAIGRNEKLIYAVHLVRVRGLPAVACVMRVDPTGPSIVMKRGREPLLVMIRYLNGVFLDDLARHHLIEAPRLSAIANPGDGEAAVRLRDDDGHGIAWLIWRPELTGTRLVGDLAPLAVVSATITIAIMVLLAARLRTTMGRLSAQEAAARHSAMHDPLTGLPNRALFADRLDIACALAERGQPSALLLLDLDRFKAINDTLGHAAGDGVLREFARRVRALLRASDTVARFGGDEFGIILPEAANREDVETLCRTIMAAAARPFGLPEGVARVGVSIGVALLPDSGMSRLEVMRAADRALYWAKGEGRSRARFFNADPAATPTPIALHAA